MSVLFQCYFENFFLKYSWHSFFFQRFIQLEYPGTLYPAKHFLKSFFCQILDPKRKKYIHKRHHNVTALAGQNSRFSSRETSKSGGKRGETAVFAGYDGIWDTCDQKRTLGD